jgi:hypothetical protein
VRAASVRIAALPNLHFASSCPRSLNRTWTLGKRVSQGGVPWSLVVGDPASPAALKVTGPAFGLYRLQLPASTGSATPVT